MFARESNFTETSRVVLNAPPEGWKFDIGHGVDFRGGKILITYVLGHFEIDGQPCFTVTRNLFDGVVENVELVISTDKGHDNQVIKGPEVLALLHSVEAQLRNHPELQTEVELGLASLTITHKAELGRGDTTTGSSGGRGRK